jgi:peptidoglycan/xylan/chitin deacetylase (PgdA/CDA1 family)
LRLLSRRRLITLLFHDVRPTPSPWIEHLYPCKTPQAFERDLRYLRESYRVVGYEQVAAHTEQGATLPRHSVSLTFDDGFATCFSIVRPLLLRYGVPCTFFIVKGTVDNRGMLWRNKASLCLGEVARLPEADVARVLSTFNSRLRLRLESRDELHRWIAGLEHRHLDLVDAACEFLGLDIAQVLRAERPYMTSEQILGLHRDGFTIGAHSCSHPRLHELSGWDEVEREIVDSCLAVRQLTGQKKVPFAIPFNGIHLDRERLAALRARHEIIGLLYDTNDLMRDRPFVLNRVWCDTPRGDSEDGSNLRFLIKRAHGLEPLRKLKRRLHLGRELPHWE